MVAGVGAAVAYATLARLTARLVRRILTFAGLVSLGVMLPVERTVTTACVYRRVSVGYTL